MATKKIESKFFSFTFLPSSRVSPTGSHFCDVLSESVDKNGISTVVVTGETNFDEYIQSFRDDCDIYKILDRLTLSGGQLPSVDPNSFADISRMPTSIHEAMKSVNEARLIFSRLSPDIRKKYSNNFNEFLADFGSDNFNSLFFSKKNDVSDTNVESGDSNASGS